jgi:AGCS family alanine or glycine:cation symporter
MIGLLIGTGSLSVVWSVADTLDGLMALPNLLALLASIPLLLKLQREFSAAARRS